MRIRLWIAAGVVTCCTSATAQMESAVREFGLEGSWAADCSKPFDHANLRAVYTFPVAGKATYRAFASLPQPIFEGEIQSARMVADEKIELTMRRIKPEPSIHAVIVLQKLPPNRYRLLHSTLDGSPWVRDGVTLQTRERMRTLEKCRN
jgi:hypothetical protein